MELSRERKNEIIGIFITAFAILLGVSLFSDTAGIVGSLLKGVFTVLTGNGAFLFPFLLFLWGVRLIRSHSVKISPRLVGLLIVLTAFLVFLHVFSVPHGREFPEALAGNGGGIVGSTFSFMLRRFIGEAGTYIVLSATTLIGTLLLFDVLLVALFSTLKRKGHSMYKSILNWLRNFKENFFKLSNLKFFRKKKVDDNEDYDFSDDQDDQFLEELAILDVIPPRQQVACGNEVEIFEAQENKMLLEQEDQTGGQVQRGQLTLKEAQSMNRAPKQNQSPVQSKPRPKQIKRVSGPYKLPPIKFLTPAPNSANKSEAVDQSQLLQETLQSFGVKAQILSVSHGPTISRYELQPAPGVKVSRIVNLADDIALAMAATDVRIVAPIPGKAAVGVEVPNPGSSMVKLKDIINSDSFKKSKSKLTMALGVDIAGEPVIADLVGMPHMLVAGATGSGKSVCVNTLILSILYKAKPNEVKFLLVDPKKVEMTAYQDLPHLLAPVVTDPKKASAVLKMVVQEMENRYDLFAGSGTRGIESYNQLMRKRQEAFQKAQAEGIEVDGSLSDHQPLPYIVVIIDELADLMMVAANDVEDAICRLAQMARAAGIHLIIATQRPSVDVITGLIKANIPSRISFAVSSAIDSRTILDSSGAEKLLGKGDMLFAPVGSNKPRRVQGAFVSSEEVHQVMDFVKRQALPEYADAISQAENGELVIDQVEERDELYEEAVRIVVSSSASISMLQRRLHIGYARAARLIDTMERDGIVGPYAGSKPRDLLVTQEEAEELLSQI